MISDIIKDAALLDTPRKRRAAINLGIGGGVAYMVGRAAKSLGNNMLARRALIGSAGLMTMGTLLDTYRDYKANKDREDIEVDEHLINALASGSATVADAVIMQSLPTFASRILPGVGFAIGAGFSMYDLTQALKKYRREV